MGALLGIKFRDLYLLGTPNLLFFIFKTHTNLLVTSAKIPIHLNVSK